MESETPVLTSLEPTETGFEIEVLADPPAEIIVPIPGGCNSSNGSNSSSNDPEVS
jgi:hypothetical protein